MIHSSKTAGWSKVARAIVFALASALWCHAADVVFVRAEANPSQEQHELEIAESFYGLDLNYITVGFRLNNQALSRAVERDSTLAVVIEARSLSHINRGLLLRALQRKSGEGVPLLIVGITPQIDPELLQSWSNGAVTGCHNLESSTPLQYAFGDVPDFTRQLSGTKIPLAAGHTFYLSLHRLGDTPEKAQQILGARSETGQPVVLLVAVRVQKQRVLFVVKMPPSNLAKEWTPENVAAAFAEIAPVMMFVKHSAGEQGWHSIRHYANLTIDDPWLREPYGFVNYGALLQQMQRHNFHTEIAFIPWNYERSQPEVVALFKNHSDRFSICVHGNDHDHKEFTDLETKPLAVQVAALRQAMVRMASFQTRTGIPYDDVFVFPHSIGSEAILGELKSRNFLATVNSSNVPMDLQRPVSLLFELRPVTLSFADFPSLLRYPPQAQTDSGFLAMNAFLDNPLLFYCHHDFFASGMDAFNPTADAVNSLEPGTRWSSLGEIVRHLYLVKKRDNSNYDALSFTQDLQLENTTAREITYSVKKQESAAPSTISLLFDGTPSPFVLRDGYLEFRMPVPAGATRRAQVVYAGAAAIPVSASKTSFRVYFLRESSDFRDNVLAKFALGRDLADLYYKYQLSPVLVVLCVLALILSVVCVVWRVRVAVLAHHEARAQTATPVRSTGSRL